MSQTTRNAAVYARRTQNAKTLALEKTVMVMQINASKREEATHKAGLNSCLPQRTYLLVLVEVALKS